MPTKQNPPRRLPASPAPAAAANSTVTTQLTPPAPGQAWPGQGGIYAGVMRNAAGKPPHHLIVPKVAGPTPQLAWGPYLSIPHTNCDWDGAANTAAILASGLDCPAARFCAEFTQDGHTDFYLPSKQELVLCLANLPDLFEQRWHWSSTQYSDNGAWSQNFSFGIQYSDLKKAEGRVRAVRRLVLEPFNTLA